MSKRCAACGQIFRPRPQVPNQAYCSDPECQRKRRQRWQQEKRQNDPDYRDNDSRYNKNWVADNPDYWGQYRIDHPGYTEKNRELQQIRNQKNRKATIAKVDASVTYFPLPSGRYRLTPVTADGIAKEDAWIVEITALSASCEDSET
jgi:hypothetical protein